MLACNSVRLSLKSIKGNLLIYLIE